MLTLFLKNQNIKKKSKIKIKNKMDKRLKCKTTEIKDQSEIELLGGQVIE
jgi:hypothetical protein